MKLYNHTGIDDKILRPFLVAAAHAAGLRPIRNVAIKVFFGQRASVAYRWQEVNWHWLTRRPRARKTGKTRWLKCNGCIELTVKWPHVGARGRMFKSPERVAERLYQTAVHEFKHVADFRNGEIFGQWKRSWENRPHEIRAVCQSREAVDALETDMRRQELILNVGIELEGLAEGLFNGDQSFRKISGGE